MKDIIIDCSQVASPADLHRLFAEALDFHAWYGSNLDALHDCLTALPGPVRIRILGWDTAVAALGPRARSARRAILEAALENRALSLTFD